jgi:hypothetical protein
MAYNKQYYDDRKKDLEDSFNQLKERTFERMIRLIDEWRQDSNKLQQKFQELSVKENEAKKADEEISKKKFEEIEKKRIEEQKKKDKK